MQQAHARETGRGLFIESFRRRICARSLCREETMPATKAISETVRQGRPQRTEISWTSNALGVISETVEIFGTILGIEFVPNTDSYQPSNSYNVTLADAAG